MKPSTIAIIILAAVVVAAAAYILTRPAQVAASAGAAPARTGGEAELGQAIGSGLGQLVGSIVGFVSEQERSAAESTQVAGT
jgi:hypothetical protein